MDDKFILDNQRVFTTATSLIALLADFNASGDQALAAARWAFASALMQNLAIKERHLYTKLEHDSRPEVRAYFARSKADLLNRFQSYTEHMATWSTSSALVHWPIYRVKAVYVVEIFIERLEAERSLLALANQYNIDTTMPSLATTNWTRKAFEVKDKVDDH